jgi:cob(I)alamin adenosyltransferase
MLIINTGNGKGKTTAAIGQIIRALGHGQKVCLIQLFKGKDFYGEQFTLKKLKNLDFQSFAPKHPYCFGNVSRQAAAKQCMDALKAVRKLAKGRKIYDLVVLDEFNIALREGYIKLKALLDVINELSLKSSVIITGRSAPKQLIAVADLVTEMKEIKHPLNEGVRAGKGIEF